MGLLDFDLKGGLNESFNRITSPFTRKTISVAEMKGALERNDFPKGFEIIELQEGKLLDNEKVILLGDQMPQIPFEFGGDQKIVKDFYPGNTEPTVQVLGAREGDITIRGRLKAKRFGKTIPQGFTSLTSSPTNANVLGQDPESAERRDESFRRIPREKQELIEAIRIRGNLVRITMGDFQRFGFLETAIFRMKTLADIDYELTFSIIGFNPPSDCKILGRAKTIPVDINKELIAAVDTLLEDFGTVPDSVPRSLGEQISDAVSDVASVVTLVTDFVDNVLTEVDSVRNGAARAEGLIKNARAFISSTSRRIGAFDPLGQVNINTGNGVSAGYINSAFFGSFLSSLGGMALILASLSAGLKNLAETEPLGRHRVKSGDTLQTIAQKFYQDQTQWEEIYDHNRLTDTNLESLIGEILEIPRIS